MAARCTVTRLMRKTGLAGRARQERAHRDPYPGGGLLASIGNVPPADAESRRHAWTGVQASAA